MHHMTFCRRLLALAASAAAWPGAARIRIHTIGSSSRASSICCTSGAGGAGCDRQAPGGFGGVGLCRQCRRQLVQPLAQLALGSLHRDLLLLRHATHDLCHRQRAALQQKQSEVDSIITFSLAAACTTISFSAAQPISAWTASQHVGCRALLRCSNECSRAHKFQHMRLHGAVYNLQGRTFAGGCKSTWVSCSSLARPRQYCVICGCRQASRSCSMTRRASRCSRAPSATSANAPPQMLFRH